MFSGIIEHRAKILSIHNGTFCVENAFSESVHIGQSIAHDGACMTVTKISDHSYEFFAMMETLMVTNFGSKKPGDSFNVERSLMIGDRIDGHFVTGHVDVVGKVSYMEKQSDGSLLLGVDFDKQYSRFVAPKGSIALNGVSLTIVKSGDGYGMVSLIPITQEWTNLGNIHGGDSVNIEFDMIAKYIAQNFSFHH